ncbi:exonuclease SbcCD subunit D [Reinekea sp.]|jgi:exonuclease SbcD|uniref:exonuclease SbcCD subunit D n=1 Tax=Reinekea sp. TaxID=1970455 RepID=UPI002A83453B|nr:exonuclease SbcCD subunit D [Reinekea sp.]
MRVLHTSDWHLGRQFHNVSLLEDQRHVLQQLIERVRTEACDVVLIAGDIYDRSVPPAEAVALLNETLSTLCLDMGVAVVMISGNHDGPERLGFGADLLQAAGLHIISDLDHITRPVVIERAGQSVHFYGIPFCTPERVRHHFQVPVHSFDAAHTYLVNEIRQQLAQDSPGSINVLLSHCFVGGALVSESERPLSIGGADTVSWQPMSDFDYVALGHLHAPQFRGQEQIRYCGSLLKYSFSEVSQDKGVVLIDLLPGQPVQMRTEALLARRGMRIIEGEFEAIVAAAFDDPQSDDYLLIRLTDKTAILDAMGKLRGLYPNLLHLEKPGVMVDNPLGSLSKEQLKRGEFELFADFFQQTLGEPMVPAQREALARVIGDLHQGESRAGAPVGADGASAAQGEQP